ncbi:MAG: DUF1294 domain-containing protein [Proteobacteria bacterium]|nr:DUF1294 domain-containing protein [Pseudomonadota bacterium]
MNNLNIILLVVAIVYIIVINIVAFVMFGADKRKAENHAWRTSEGALFGVAIFGGSIGALAGMIHFRHKTKHPSFQIGIPAILIVQLIFAAGLIWVFLHT